MTPQTHGPLMLLPTITASVALTLTLLAQAAETAPAKPMLLVPAAASASAASAPAKPRAPAARKPTRALGGDDDLKDLEVERVRGRKR